jgi:hypothetical protein
MYSYSMNMNFCDCKKKERAIFLAKLFRRVYYYIKIMLKSK